MIKIKNLKNVKPKQPWDVKVYRGVSALGNKFIMYNESERDKVCDEYKVWFDNITNPLNDYKYTEERIELLRFISLYQEYGKLNLFCFCAPKRCHTETVREYIYSVVGLF